MFDFDPRDYDSRDGDRHGSTPDRGDRGASDDRDRDGDCRQPERSRDRDHDARTLGRGPGNRESSHSNSDAQDRREDARWPDRGRDCRERDVDPRDVFTRHLDLPRGLEREIVRDRDREYTLRGSESRTLATVGSFRVVSSRDLRDHNDRPAEPRAGDLRHLREQKLIETIPVPGYRDHAVVLTKEGRSLLEHHRDRDHEPRQTFYSGLKRERELEHDLIRLVFPRPLDRFYDAYQTVIREELETPLHPATISELKWYFQHRRAAGHGPVHPQTQGFLDVGAKVFGSPPLIRLYRRWLRRGDAVFEAVSSPAIADALAAGTACIESLVLPHAYRHLFPLVAEKHPSSGVEKWDEGGDETSARP